VSGKRADAGDPQQMGELVEKVVPVLMGVCNRC
jgi:hypothetical protein